MSSSAPSDRALLDLERDIPTTAEDVRMLRELRRQTPSWLDLSSEEVEALLPPEALRQRPPTPPNTPPFSLE